MIPEWNIQGLLPPIKPEEDGSSPIRSPYEVDIITFIDRFAISKDRCNILDGFLKYRKALYDVGIYEGFQWLNGSFIQDVEMQENRSPNDIDVVTFLVLPEQFDEDRLRELFDAQQTKKDFFVDAYPFQLNQKYDASAVKSITYWYSMWSHTRDKIWKGFIQVMLDSEKDAEAKALLDAIKKEKGYE